LCSRYDRKQTNSPSPRDPNGAELIDGRFSANQWQVVAGDIIANIFAQGRLTSITQVPFVGLYRTRPPLAKSAQTDRRAIATWIAEIWRWHASLCRFPSVRQAPQRVDDTPLHRQTTGSLQSARVRPGEARHGRTCGRTGDVFARVLAVA